jgi:hypothetical protein
MISQVKETFHSASSYAITLIAEEEQVWRRWEGNALVKC